jgi:hypothetical protein
MRIQRSFSVGSLSLLPLLLLAAYWATGQQKTGTKRTYVCPEPNPQGMCSAANTCGSASAACRLDIKRTDYGASVTPNIPGAKGNATFCVRQGTAITWQTSAKNTGFTVDFGTAFPFDPAGFIMGGSDKTVSDVAKTPGCYKFSVGACNTDAIYGMCAEGSAEIIVAAK